MAEKGKGQRLPGSNFGTTMQMGEGENFRLQWEEVKDEYLWAFKVSLSSSDRQRPFRPLG